MTFSSLVTNDTEAAAAIVENAINADDENPKLYLNMLDIRLNSSPLNVEAVLKVIDQAGAKLGVSNPRYVYHKGYGILKY